MHCKFVIHSVVFALIAVATPVFASTIVINPSDYPIGTDLSTMFDGITLATVRNTPGVTTFAPISSAVLVTSADSHHYPGNGIGANAANLLDYGSCVRTTTGNGSCGLYSMLELVFATPTDSVSIESVGFNDEPNLFAYDVFGNPLSNSRIGHASSQRDWFYDTGLYYSTFTNTIMTAEPQIARVVFAAIVGGVKPTRIEYHSVPEPSTLLFLAVGSVGVLFRRKAEVRP